MSKKIGLSSRLKHRMELQEPVRASDGTGGFYVTWVKVKDVWVEILPSRGFLGKESLKNGVIENNNNYYITIRYSNYINYKMRLLTDEGIFHIRSVTDPVGDKKQMLLLAETGVES